MQIDALLKALSDPTRLRIMRLLAHMELAVGELAQVLNQSQPRVSRHVRILCEAGLAERRKEGSWVFLKSAIAEDRAPPLGAAAARLLAAGERDDPRFAERCAEDRRNLADIRAARETQAEQYFARHAEQWDTLRVMHTPDAPVEAALARALSELSAGGSLGKLLDIGTGTGRIAELLAENADLVTAFDKSPEMLRLARARLQGLPAGKVDLVQGDFLALPFADHSFDTILLHQVLHYAQDPRRVLMEAGRIARDGARIAVVDFAAHDREELRESHAHARLGFSDAQMIGLLSDAGFAGQPPIALPGTPLTVKIWSGVLAGAAANRTVPSHPLASAHRK